MNTLYFGDNLDIMRDKIPDESIALIYLDPPFQSGKAYGMVFQPTAKDIPGADAEIHAFEDTWKWSSGEAEREYRNFVAQWDGKITKEPPSQAVIELMSALRGYLGECSMMAYLVMMAPRLWEMRRVLKPTGSIYLHCDPTASHYLKILMDAVFGAENFRNEIVWRKIRSSKGQTDGFGFVHDIILSFRKTALSEFNRQYVPLEERRIEQHYSSIEPETGRKYMLDNFTQAGDGPARVFGGKELYPPHGKHWIWTQEKIDEAWTQGRLVFTSESMVRVKRYLDDSRGNPVDDLWTDIPPINAMAAERVGYPTQKPEALLERIIVSSSNEGDPVLDPFCGCGTSAVVSERLHRPWIGIDITYVAINVMKQRFEKNGLIEGQDFTVRGIPKDVYSAGELAKSNPYEFQIWCISQLPATQSGKPSGDKGVDGFINFINPMQKSQLGRGLISVKGGQTVVPSMVQELIGAMQNHRADFGILITLKQPTGGMKEAAGIAGVFDFQYSADTVHQQVPKVQLLTVEDLFKKPIPVVLPGNIVPPFKTPPVRKVEQKRIEL